MSVLYNGLVEHPNSHFDATLPTNGFIENKLVVSGDNYAYSPSNTANDCKSFATINLQNHISGNNAFQGQTYRMVFDFIWSGYTSGQIVFQGAVDGIWNNSNGDANYFVLSARNYKLPQTCVDGASSGTFHYDFLVNIPSSANNHSGYSFGFRADNTHPGTYYKVSNYRVYSYNGGIDTDKMSFNHFYEW
jgi:hypothetical protein